MFGWIGQQILIIGDVICAGWALLGANSGQIQTVIGGVAFWLAYKGYAKLLEHRSVDSKMVFINLLHEAYRENIKYLQLSRKLDGMYKILKEIDELTKEELAIIDRYLPYLQSFKKSLKSIKVELERIYGLPDQLGVEDLEKYSFSLNQKMKEFVKASNGFNVIELEFQKILDKYKN
jgi:hypothetical protein